MKKMDLASILAVALTVAFSITGLTGCGSTASSPSAETELATGGVLHLKVNPEIAVAYDADGLVTSVTARNEDAKKILENYTGFEGKEARTVVSELVIAIGKAGYFVEEIDGERRQITIEIESGSKLPSTTFLDDVAEEVRRSVNSNNWTTPVDLRGESDYGMTDYVDTDYGPNNDGFTDYNDTDYGPNNDGITDYGATDYGDRGVTDYDNRSTNYTDYSNRDHR